MLTADALLRMSRRELAGVLARGHAIDPRALDDAEYKGVSLGLPEVVERATWKVFEKVFHRDPADGSLRGWNVRMVQHGVDGPLVAQEVAGLPRTFGHYRVVPLTGYRVPRPCGPGLMLDYGLGGNRPLDPMTPVRDPLVAVNPGSVDLLLGWTYLDLGGPLRIPTPSYFSLERVGPLSHVALPPCSE